MTRHVLSWMDDRLPSGDIDRISSGLRGSGRRMQLLHMLDFPSLGDHDTAQTDRIVQEHVSDLIDGRNERLSEMALRELASHAGDCSVDETSLEMLRATGMDAAILLFIAYALSRDEQGGLANVRIPSFIMTSGPARGMEAQVSFEISDRVMIKAPFAAQSCWEEDGVVTIDRPLPNSVCVAIQGRSLRDVVDHPILNQRERVISKVVTGNLSPRTRLELTGERSFLTMRDLSMETTRPDRRYLSSTREAPRRSPVGKQGGTF